MWIAQLCGYVKLEVRVVVDFLVAEFDYDPVPLLDERFVEDRA